MGGARGFQRAALFGQVLGVCGARLSPGRPGLADGRAGLPDRDERGEGGDDRGDAADSAPCVGEGHGGLDRSGTPTVGMPRSTVWVRARRSR